MPDALQDEYRSRMKRALPGGDPDLSFLVEDREYLNDDPRAAKVITVSIDTVRDDHDYSLTIEDTTFTVTSDSTATDQEIRDSFITKINNSQAVNGIVLAETDTSNTFTVTERIAGEGFTLTENDDDLSLTTTNSGSSADPIEFGRAVFFHALGGDDNEDLLGRKPDASNLTARDVQLTLSGFTASDTVMVAVRVEDDYIYASDTGAADLDTLLQNLRDDLNNGSDLLSASVNISPTPSELHIQPETAGFADFEVTQAKPPEGEEFTITTPEEGDDVRTLFAGLAKRNPDYEADPSNDPDLTQYPGGERMTVRAMGGIVVKAEDNPDLSASPEGRVYIRMSANGNNDQLGELRSTWESGAVPLPKEMAQFVQPMGDFDVVKLKGAR